MEPLQDSIFCLEQIFQGVFTWSAVLSILLNRVNDAFDRMQKLSMHFTLTQKHTAGMITAILREGICLK